MAERRSSFEFEDLLACGRGELFGPGNAQLAAAADADVRPHLARSPRPAARTARARSWPSWRLPATTRLDWFFDCHFKGDPVMPGCLGLDALWQLTGFFLGWLGAPGRGRALGVGEVKFTGMVLPTIKKVEYVVDIKRVILRKLKLAIADGMLKADGEVIYTATDLRVGLFETGEAAAALRRLIVMDFSMIDFRPDAELRGKL